MGAWGSGSFDNDAACDFAAEMSANGDLALVQQAIAVALDPGETYLDADDGSRLLAACEVLARLQDHGGVRDSYSAKVDAWVEAHPQKPAGELIARAVAAIDRVLGDDSELVELWDDDDEWRAAVVNLRDRLAAS